MYLRLGPPGTLTLSARSHAAFMRLRAVAFRRSQEAEARAVRLLGFT